jgi:glutaredoxin
MRPTFVLRMYSARLTLFTKSDCGLCDTAKTRLAEVQKRRTVEYREVDIMKEENKEWFNAYAFDVPVLHVSRVFHTYSKPDIVSEEKKLFHRFSEKEVETLIDDAEQQVQVDA